VSTLIESLSVWVENSKFDAKGGGVISSISFWEQAVLKVRSVTITKEKVSFMESFLLLFKKRHKIQMVSNGPFMYKKSLQKFQYRNQLHCAKQ
jgi:hypothetical protein